MWQNRSHAAKGESALSFGAEMAMGVVGTFWVLVSLGKIPREYHCRTASGNKINGS